MTKDSAVPKKKIFLAHNSCLNSSYDFNLLKEGLKRGGYKIVDQPEDADEVIFSGCAVREIWVDDAINQIDAIHERAPKATITVTGCVANVSADNIRRRSKAEKLTFERHEHVLRNFTGLELTTLDRQVSQDTSLNFEGEKNNGLSQLRHRVGPDKAAAAALLQQVDREFGTKLEHFYRRTTKGFVFYHEEDATELITVTRGCPYKCSFCAIPRGRGDFISVPLEAILEKARSALARGIRNFLLVGDEVGNYGVDGDGAKFGDMLNALLSLDEGLRLSIRYIEPKPFLRSAALLHQLCLAGRIELLYVSLQSGSQRVLNAMNRNYDIEKVAEVYGSLCQDTDTILYCNWMVGFPGETHEEYLETVSLVKKLNLHINIAIPFSPRPDTPADGFTDQVSETEKEARVKALMNVIADIKIAAFAAKLDFLDQPRRLHLLQKIKDAEMVHYEDLRLDGANREALST